MAEVRPNEYIPSGHFDLTFRTLEQQSEELNFVVHRQN